MEQRTATLIQAVSAIVTTVTTVVLAVFTGWYVKLTGRMAAAMKETREPAVELDVEIQQSELYLVLSNRGANAASNVKLRITSPLDWLQDGGTPLTDLPVVRVGLDHLAPERVLRFDAGYIDWPAAAANGGVIAASIDYQNADGRHFTRAVRINVAQYEGVTVASFDSPVASIAEALREMNRRAQERDLVLRFTGAGGKVCPACGKMIPHAARKCYRCGEEVALAAGSGDAEHAS